MVYTLQMHVQVCGIHDANVNGKCTFSTAYVTLFVHVLELHGIRKHAVKMHSVLAYTCTVITC